MLGRIANARSQEVQMTNYGVAIAYLSGMKINGKEVVISG
ncbi:hypothetical protein [Bacteroides heparinolyticus]